MFNPGMFGVNPQQMEAAKEVGQHLRIEIRKYHKQGKLEVQFFLVNPEENYDLGRPVVPGLYWCRWEGAQSSQTRRMLFVR